MIIRKVSWRKLKTITLIIVFFSSASLSCTGNDISVNKEKARDQFLKATTKLSELGGIASFESPFSQTPFPQSKTKGMTAKQLKGDLDKIITDLKDAIVLDPDLNEAHYFLGVAYTRLQNKDKAIKAFERAIEVEPRRELSYIVLCNLLWSKNEYEKAVRISSIFLEKFPEKKIVGLLLLGTTYYKQGDFKKAVEMGSEIVSLDDKNIAGHILIASSHYFIGNREISEAEFSKVVEIEPQMATEIGKIKEQIKKRRVETQGQ